MRLTEAELKQIVQEEIEQAIEEGWWDKLKARKKSLGARTQAWGTEKAAKFIGKHAPKTSAALGTAAKEMRDTGRGKESKSLMQSHSKKVEKAVTNMIADATKLGLLKDPTMKKALASTKSVVTRLNNLTKALDPPVDQGEPAAVWSTGQKGPGASAPAPDPADAETLQVAPVTDIGSASPRKKSPDDEYKAKWAKRAGIRKE